MAVSGVKARLMLFETAESNNMVTERKDSKGEPPALQKFRQNQQQLQENKNGGQASMEGRPPVAQKPGPLNARKNSNAEADSVDSGSGGGVVGKLNVAKMFQQGDAPPPLKPVVPFKRPGTMNSEKTGKATSPNAERPKVALKPPNKVSSPTSPTSPDVNSQEKTIPSNKPQSNSDGNKSIPLGKPAQSAVKPSSVVANGGDVAVNHHSGTAPIKLPSIGSKPVLKKTESSTSSASSSSSTSSKLSSSSLTSENTCGPFDFRKHLKSRPSLGGNSDNASSSQSTTKASTDDPLAVKPDSVKRSSSPDNVPAEEIVQRQSDCKRFKKVKLSSLPPASDEALKKPELPEGGIDLTLLCQQHARTLCNEEDLPPPLPSGDFEEEDIYDDGTSAVEVRQPPEKSNKNRESGRVSMIPEMTAEDEGLDIDEIYDDGITDPPVDILYVDAASDAQPSLQQEEEIDDIYEDESNIESMREESEEAKKKRLKEEVEALKREQKRKKDEEKKKKQEEKEEKNRRKKFNLTGDETNVGEGTIKEDAKGRGNNLTVKKGDKVIIVRTDNNPANKFLVKTDTEMGYVDSKNIEIDPEIIRKVMLRSLLSTSTPEGLEKSIAALMSREKIIAMKNNKKGSTSIPEDDNQELYSDVPEEIAEEPLEEEDIYQCVE
ncbi:hypothetical protein EGW08_003682 [Elysia chlorotica]|uniref:SH3 domain-containing protein n=1 Tax=Elysia chlorotica TaxID=188477 RepID=A0A433U427_ELYCH|nr:hypothetical protein EGW08_003682 [Elysia chlorotica]